MHFLPFLQLSSTMLTQKKHQPNLHHATGAAGGNQVLDTAENPGHKAPLQYTYDQQLKEEVGETSGQQLLQTPLVHTKHLIL